MALVNHVKKEINAKIVYFGPEFAGKATNLNHIFNKLKESFRGTFKSMNLQNDRMLFFDFIPSGQGILEGYTIHFHVYTVTGAVNRASSWKMVLKGVDGVIFVADSAPNRMAANVESLKLLDSCLGAYEKRLSDIPCVIQCNKRDLPGAAGLEAMGRVLNSRSLTMVPAVAQSGEGVLESIFGLVKMVLKNLRAGGLELDHRAEQLHRMARPSAPDHREATSAEETDQPEVGTAELVQDAAGEGEPVVEFSGAPEILCGGRLRLPLTIKYEGKEKRIALDISLVQDRD
jgi:uncharacterized protein